MTTLTEVLDFLEGLDPADCAGTLTTISSPDTPVPLDKLRVLMQVNGLDDTLVPPKRAEVFDFANACRSVETKRGKTKGERVSVGEVVTNGVESVYQVTREQVDEQGRKIDHPKAMRVVYDKGYAAQAGVDPIRVEPMEADHYQALAHLEAEIRVRFSALRGTVPGSKVRAIVRELMRRMNATRWSRSQSIWFAPIERSSDLHAIRSVLKGLYGDDAEFKITPLPKAPGTRREIVQAVGGHAKADAAKLIGEIAEVLKDGADVKQAQFERMRDKANDLHKYAQSMEEMLGGEVATAREALGLVNDQLITMLGRVK
jgi:ElaB/YqjD/DUF883 family membrane-anchored ribosome-binding protein